MQVPQNEQLVNYLNILEKKGRRYTTAADNRWGGLVTPASHENPYKTKDGLNVALFGSWKFGYVVLETLKRYESRFPERLNLVGLVTDNPLNPDAKISKKKRIWNIIDLPIQVVDETIMIESALIHGIPAYTGEIKIGSFHRLLRQWNPDVILVCVFGQIIDSFIIDLPPYGIYNFHPSDLARSLGAGPRPYDDLKERNAATTVWTVHHVSDELDKGHIVGQSPPVRVLDQQDRLPENPFVVYEKLTEAINPLVVSLVNELCHRFEENLKGPVFKLDLNERIPDEIRQKLMLPVMKLDQDDLLPEPDSPVFNLI